MLNNVDNMTEVELSETIEKFQNKLKIKQIEREIQSILNLSDQEKIETEFSQIIIKYGKNEDMIELFEKIYQKINDKKYATRRGKTHDPFLYACKIGNLKLVKMLHKNGSPSDTISSSHDNALDLAIIYKKWSVVEYLIENKIVNAESCKPETREIILLFVNMINNKDEKIKKLETMNQELLEKIKKIESFIN